MGIGNNCRCSEETVIDVIVEKCLNAAIERKKVYRKHFEAYQASRNDIEVLLKAEKVLESQNRFVETSTK
jgi:hypothetical protein